MAPRPELCWDGLDDGAAITVTLGEPWNDLWHDDEPCAGRDGLSTGATLEFELASVDARSTPECRAYAGTASSLPSGLAGVTVTDSSGWDGGFNGLFGVQLECERESAPGCRLTYVLEVRFRDGNLAKGNFDSTALDDENQLHYDATRTPFVLRRSIAFPQAHLCPGIADPEVRGEYGCSDAWEISLERGSS